MNNIKLVVKILAIILIACFFLPIGTVSCSSVSVNVSAAHAMVGYSDSSLGQLSNPVIILIVLLIIPIVIVSVGGIRKQFKKSEAIINIVLLIFEIVGYMIFKAGVKSYAEENMCRFSTSVGYSVIIVLCILSMIGYVLLLLGVGSDPVSNGGGMINGNAFTGVPGGGYTPPSNVTSGWTCTCGKTNSTESMFCARCGSKKPEEVQSADGGQVPVGQWTCTCGNVLNASDMFCGKCGNRKPE